MVLKLIACKVLQRELCSLLYRCPNMVDVTMIRQDYHSSAPALRRCLQEEIDRIESGGDVHTNDLKYGDLDAILLGYGLCSNSLVGLHSSRYPLVVPRAHDCITLVLGSKERYREYFDAHGDSYYYSQGWLDLGFNLGKDVLDRKRAEYREKYDDEETVEFLMEAEEEMLKNYRRITYIEWDGIPDNGRRKIAEDIAAERRFEFVRVPGDSSLLERMLLGVWEEKEFLVVPPGKSIAPSYDDGVIKAI